MRIGVGINGNASCTLSKNSDPFGITTKSSDIRVHPANSSFDVQQAKILGLRRRNKLRSVGLAKNVGSVINRDDSNIVMVTNEVSSVIRSEITLSNQPL